MEKGFSQANKRAFRNPWVIGWIAMVVIVFGVNVFMVTTAYVGSPGLVNENYYERGRDLEKNIMSRSAEQSALGWTLTLDTGEIRFRRPADFRFDAKDKTGQPLAAAKVVLYAYRPADAAADFSLPLSESAPGQYTGTVTFPLKGVWDLMIEVEHNGQLSRLARRIAAIGN